MKQEKKSKREKRVYDEAFRREAVPLDFEQQTH
jgi:hypothetical protein